MYGQKQILQCMAIAIILAVLNFHRTAIERNREIIKHKLIRKVGVGTKIKQIDEEHVCVLNANCTGYCIRYPFNKNVYANHDTDFLCRYNCFDKFETWLRKQPICQANCCIKKSLAQINKKKITKMFKIATINASQKTRNDENELMNNVGKNGASLHNIQCESVKTIIEPINEKLMNINQINPMDDYQCKIQTNNDEFICKNTTSDTVDFIKLETINKTGTIMEYNEFIFDMGPPETKTGSTQSFDGPLSSAFLAFFSFLVAIFTIRIMYKLFVTDHTEAFLRVVEMRRNLHDRLEQIHAELNQAGENEANNNNVTNPESEQRANEAVNNAEAVNSSTSSDAGDKDTIGRDADVKSKQQTSEQSK